MSNTPLLGGQGSGGQSRKQRRTSPLNLISHMGLGLFDTSSTGYDGIYTLLNIDNQEEQDKLTEQWRNHKLEELNFVGTVGALLASCLSSTSAWPDVLNNGRDKPWTVRSLNFCGLLFALFAVLIAGLQSMRLHRLSAHRDGLSLIRDGLAGSKTRQGRARPYMLQVYAWELSLVFLVASVMCLIAGISVLVWVSTEYGPGKPASGGWWDENSKMAVTFTIVMGFCFAVLMVSQSVLAGSSTSSDVE